MKKLRIGLAGLGTVGKGVYDILQKDADLITRRSGAQLEIVAAFSRTKKDFLDPKIKFYSNAIDFANDPQIDVVVEVIGGLTTAKDLIIAAIKNGKKVVTANKALLAEQGVEIAKLVEENKSYIGFEASTAGANPIIKGFKEGFAANEITEFYAILNGTCNFILTKMRDEGRDFSETLKEAQALGYAEADPAMDINGTDTAHKLVILGALAAGSNPQFAKTYVEGIEKVTIEDVKIADHLGYKIKLLAIYKNLGEELQQTVYPTLIKKSEKIAQTDGPYNTIVTLGSNSNWNVMIGRGAGGLTTGSAVVADIIDIACGRDTSPLFGVKCADLIDAKIMPISKRVGKYFLRVLVDKEMAQKTNLSKMIFGDKIDVENAMFLDRESDILCGFITNEQKEEELLNIIKNLDSTLVKSVSFLRVEATNF